MKPQHFVILYLMEVSVMVEIIQKEFDIGFTVTEKRCVYIPASAEGNVRHHRGESSLVHLLSICHVCY